MHSFLPCVTARRALRGIWNRHFRLDEICQP